MNIREVLENNEISPKKIGLIPDKVLEMDTGICREVREIPNDMCKLFDGYELYNEKDKSKMIIINLEYIEDDEFLPLYVMYYGVDGYTSVEIQYDDNLEVVYVNDLR